MKNIRFFISVFLFLCIALSINAQTRKQLESQRKKLKTEIKKVNKLLFETIKKEKNALNDLQDLNQKINVRNRLIRTINLEAKVLSNEIKTTEKEIQKLTKNLEVLKADYADMIFKSYKSKSQQSKTMFLLSSQNFHQAYKRLQYMKQYTSFRKKQGEEIAIKTDDVRSLKDSLVYQKQLKVTLILSEKEQKNSIVEDKKQQEVLISTIKKKEKKFKRELQNKLKEEKKVAAKIDKLIRDAIALSNKKRKAGVKKSKGFNLTPEAKALAGKFEQNKGRLPWPVEEGLITRKFGIQAHPTIGGITINSTGLHIATKKAAKAESIFNGKVFEILLTADGHKNVLIQHGNYITAYNNLEKTYVKKGDKVITGQTIGDVFTNKVTGKTKLIFVLYKNTKRLNPSDWILKR
ncbi:septal ring factor EnvC (AmiA/AmiB activator) [Lutibacter sp. Hel_I_33_5]|uniref:murein hydrolase activator EnvC family protein n=1 Tax=Lutibacter sp. Hel_I_33_5 TaxID=1566289 RepID=UPI0011A9C3D2|nr:peptidoglycan DD-metalloendopeptidase family protein [Lutibacter sp. Hel_I_33_5]TVZ56170.1 septal ring factor EnvC (AmiA/AmiB activator) [Lutibacter sp. Hel_I_33_5]